MRLEYQILAAAALDMLIGDPRWLPHPVRLIGRFAKALESPLRDFLRSEYLAGAVTALIIISVAGFITYLLVCGAKFLHLAAVDIVSILLLYTTFAARDLVKHSGDVYRALRVEKLDDARKRVAMIVGRDTEKMNEQEIARATVESIAENTVDGVTAPLFYAAVGGPVGAMVYKAINTLDSTFGYKNERYRAFGWASARLDDLANYIPARLTALLVPAAAALLRYRPVGSLKTLLRDGRKHPSPNAGLCEAAMAGALGIQLGGLSYYSGQPSMKPELGDPVAPIEIIHIRRANILMLVTYAMSIIAFLGARMLIVSFLN